MNAVIHSTLADEISQRAERLGITRGRYAALILERWEREGCPAVSEPDKLLQQSRFSRFAHAAEDPAPYGSKTKKPA